MTSYFKFYSPFLVVLYLEFLSGYLVFQVARSVLVYDLRLMFVLVRMPSTFIYYFIFLLTTKSCYTLSIS